jgi:serine/threonine protein kinase/protocatechuate 3,4-dioxygenase beta subunit
MNQTDLNSCPRCGLLLHDAQVDGLCARCLGALNFTCETDIPMELSRESVPVLSPEELAPHFPQLEIIECLGRGGMGVVYKAKQKSLNRFIALKLLAPERAGDPQFAARFEKEAQSLASLNHPHIVGVYDFGYAGSFYYLLMEFVDGVNLRQAMVANRFSPEQALAIVPPVCEALQHAHDHGIVHRDIKPENLLLDKEGRIKIADFGIAKIMGKESMTAVQTESQPAGTPQYMAPEQKENRATDHRADIYSLGVVLYEMLTGELPATDLKPPSSRVLIDVRIDAIVLKALETRPELRFDTASQFQKQVETLTLSEMSDSKSQSNESTTLPLRSSWVRLIESAFGLEFTSPASIRLVNLSAIGFLSCGAFLGFIPFPGWSGCFGFAGFSGLFGLIGIAAMIEVSKRRKSHSTGTSLSEQGTLRRLSGKLVAVFMTLLLVFSAFVVAQFLPITQSIVDLFGTRILSDVKHSVAQLEVKSADEKMREAFGASLSSEILLTKDDGLEEKEWDWKRSKEDYRPPNVDTYFPDDPNGGIILSKFMESSNRDRTSDFDTFSIVHGGLRRTTNRKAVLRWFGNKYVWGQSPQNPSAIELMYHAADFSGKKADPYGMRYDAVYFGLSVVHPKSPAILRTLAELAMRVDDHNDLQRIAWGCKDQQSELIEFLRPFQSSEDESIRTKAETRRRIFSGALDASVWAEKEAHRLAWEKYHDQLPKFRSFLESGGIERMTQLETIQRERIDLILDDSFLEVLEKCAEDKDPTVRRIATIIIGNRWIWKATDLQSERAIDLMMKLSKDPDRDIRYNAVYYGLSVVRDKRDGVVRRLLEIGMGDDESNMHDRIVWGLRDSVQQAERLLDEYSMDQPNKVFLTGAPTLSERLKNTKLQRKRLNTSKGQVQDEQHRPVPHAMVYFYRTRPHDLAQLQPSLVAITDQHGSFSLDKAKITLGDDEPAGWAFQGRVLVCSEEHGFVESNWIAQKDLQVTLPESSESLRGTVLDAKGIGIASAKISVLGFADALPVGLFPHPNLGTSMNAADGLAEATGLLLNDVESPQEEGAVDEQIKKHLANEVHSLLHSNDPLRRNEVLPTAISDNNGRFELKNVGPNRLLRLLVEGDRIETTVIFARNVDDSIFEAEPIGNSIYGTQKVYGNEFECQIAASVPIEGIVTDSDTNRPISNAIVRTFALGDFVHASTNEEGIYRLVGVPKNTKIALTVFTLSDAPYVPVGKEVDTSNADQALKVDFTMKQGLWAHGVVTDGTTNRPLTGEISYFWMPDDPTSAQFADASEANTRWFYYTDELGRFQVPVLPCRGFLSYEWDGSIEERNKPHSMAERLARGVISVRFESGNIGPKGYFPTVPRSLIPGQYRFLTDIRPAVGRSRIDVAMTPRSETTIDWTKLKAVVTLRFRTEVSSDRANQIAEGVKRLLVNQLKLSEDQIEVDHEANASETSYYVQYATAIPTAESAIVKFFESQDDVEFTHSPTQIEYIPPKNQP